MSWDGMQMVAAPTRFEQMVAKAQAQFEVDVPPEMRQGMMPGNIAPRITRREALQVPAVMRGRNLICGTLATLPIHVRDTDRHIATPTTLFEQIDPDVPNVVTYANTYEDLLFEGTAWWRVTAFGWHDYPVYAEHIGTSRINVVGWLPPVNGVGPQATGSVYVDGYPVPDNQLIRFDSPNPPLLVHAARAIRAALALDQSASRYATENLPLGYFTPKEGVRFNEDDTHVTGILDKWETSRSRRVWAFVPGMLEAKTLQFNAEQIQLADQRQHAVLEIARAIGVDPEDLGVSTTSRTYQNSEQRRQDMLDFTFAAYRAAMEQRLSMRDVLPQGYEAKVNLDSFLRSDTLGRMQAYKIAEEVKALTEDEVRELEDRPLLTPAQRGAMTPPVPAPVQPPMQGVPNG
jgi:hypothetical protein